MKQVPIALLLILASPLIAQAPKPAPDTTVHTNVTGGEATAVIPIRRLDFRLIDSDPGLSVSPITRVPSHCDSDGTLFLDMLDPKDLSQDTVVSIRGKKSHTYSPKHISDLHDITVHSFFPTDSIVGFLVRGTK